MVVTLLKGIPKLAKKGWKDRRIRAMNRIGEQKIVAETEALAE